MTPPLPAQAAGASSIGAVPDLPLAVLAAFALVVACLAQSVEQGVSRLSAAAVEDLAEQGRARAGVLAGLVAHRRRTLLVLRSARTLWQVVFAVSVTLILVDKGIAWWAVALIAVASVSALQFLFVSLVPSQWAARRPLAGDQGHEEELQGGDGGDGDEGHGPPGDALVDQDERDGHGEDHLPQGARRAQDQQGAPAVGDQARQHPGARPALLGQVLHGGGAQARHALFDALRQARHHQGEGGQHCERQVGHGPDRRGARRLGGQRRGHRDARKVRSSLRCRANISALSASSAWS